MASKQNSKALEIGEIDLVHPISDVQIQELKSSLLNSGFELLQDKKSILIEKIVVTIIQMVHYENHFPKTNYSEYISEKLQYDYTYLANTFSEVKGTTIEHFIITHKIERVKELLVYNEQTLTEIAYKMHYSSVAHLSTQFKKVTGMTASHFKALRENRRSMLENV